jgi:hypothetical protein
MGMTMMTGPGWYADPADVSMVRWWDGVRWTQHAQPAVYGAQALPPVGPPVPPESQRPAKLNFFGANLVSLIIVAFAVISLGSYYLNGVLFIGFLPLGLAYWAARRGEPLRVPAGILALVVFGLSLYYVRQF